MYYIYEVSSYCQKLWFRLWVKLNGWKNDPSLESAVEQLKVENRNRPKSNQIKVVVEYH
jgi:hypothetical protein